MTISAFNFTVHSEGDEIRIANERLRNPLKISRLLRATNYQGIPHIVRRGGSPFGMTSVNVK